MRNEEHLQTMFLRSAGNGTPVRADVTMVTPPPTLKVVAERQISLWGSGVDVNAEKSFKVGQICDLSWRLYRADQRARG